MFNRAAVYELNRILWLRQRSAGEILSVMAVLFSALLLGAIASTANPILAAMGGALVVGSVLLFYPIIILWLVLILGLLVAGLLPLFFGQFATKVTWGVSLLSFMLMGLVFVRALVDKKFTESTPWFVWLAFIFMVYAIVLGMLRSETVLDVITGSKRYFQAWGIIFAVGWLCQERLTIVRLRKFMILVAVTQLPFALYQLLYWVPRREAALSLYPGMVPEDVVAGTMGALPFAGGANGEMSAFLVMMFGFLLARFHYHCLSLKTLIMLGIPIVTPLFLGEAKIVIVMLPLTLVMIYHNEIFSRPAKMALILVFALGFAWLALYISVIVTGLESISVLIENTLAYNVYDLGHGGLYLNRTSVLTFWWSQQGLHDPVGFLFGNGIGSVYEGAGQGLGHIAQQFPGYGLGLTSASTLLWETGVFGTSMFFGVFLMASFAAAAHARKIDNPAVKADLLAIRTAFLVLLIHAFYRSALLQTLSFQIIAALLLGYLCWLIRCKHIESLVHDKPL